MVIILDWIIVLGKNLQIPDILKISNPVLIDMILNIVIMGTEIIEDDLDRELLEVQEGRIENVGIHAKDDLGLGVLVVQGVLIESEGIQFEEGQDPKIRVDQDHLIKGVEFHPKDGHTLGDLPTLEILPVELRYST